MLIQAFREKNSRELLDNVIHANLIKKTFSYIENGVYSPIKRSLHQPH